MNSHSFSLDFELLPDSPSGMGQIRQLVLQLGITGRLKTQDLRDEPAPVLIEVIRQQKLKLAERNGGRAGQWLPPIHPAEQRVQLPKNWAWIRLGDIGDWGAGTTPPRSRLDYYGGRIRWFKSGELNDGILTDSEETITEQAVADCSLRLNAPGAVLVAMYGATIGKVAILGTEATTNQAVCACKCFDGVFNRYLMLLLKAYKPYFISKSAGGAQPNFSKDKIVREVALLPPLEEQKRIVTKIEQLLALCDDLESRQELRRKARIHLNDAVLAPLVTVTNRAEFTAAWRRVRDNFDLLYAAPENVIKLRQVILQMAVQGKLAPQDPNDEPASSVVMRIRAMYDESTAGAMRLRLAPIRDDEVPDLPSDRWTWARLGELADIVSGVTKGRDLNGKRTQYFSYLRVANVQAGFLDLTEMKQIEIPIQELPKYRLQSGDIVLTEGGDWDKLGRSAIWDGKIENCIHQNHVFRARLLKEAIRPRWITLFTNSPVGRQYFQNAAKQTTNLASINMTQLKNCPIPLPPTPEQDRILARVDLLIALCHELEEKLNQRRDDADRLAQAVVNTFVNGKAPDGNQLR